MRIYVQVVLKILQLVWLVNVIDSSKNNHNKWITSSKQLSDDAGFARCITTDAATPGLIPVSATKFQIKTNEPCATDWRNRDRFDQLARVARVYTLVRVCVRYALFWFLFCTAICLHNSKMRDVTASGRAERIIRKYPEFLTSLCDIRTYEMAKSKSDATLRRVLRKDTERTRRLRRFRKTPYSRLDGFGSVLFDALDENKDIFTCPMCRKVLLVPTTVDCGHTFCGHCRDQINNGKCYCCQSDIGSRMCTNTLIQSLVDKWRESRRERQISNGKLLKD